VVFGVAGAGGQARAQDRAKVEVVPQIAHSASINSVAFSHNGARLLSGSLDGSLMLWDTASGLLIRTFEGHSLSFTPDGRRVLSGGKDGVLRLWDVATGQLICTFEGHSDWITSVAFSPDGTRLVSGNSDKTLKLWDAAAGELIRTFEGHSDEVSSAAFSPDGRRVLSGGKDGVLRLWDVATGELIRTFEGHSHAVNSVAFSPDGTRVLSGSQDETLKLWAVESGLLVRTFERNANVYAPVTSVAFSPDGARVLSGSDDAPDSGPGPGHLGSEFGTLKLWDAASGQLIRTFEGHSDGVLSVAFSADGTRVLSGGNDRMLKLWDVASGQLIRSFGRQSAEVSSVASSPDGKRMFSGGEDKTLRLWDAASGQLIRAFEGHSHVVNSVAFSPDGTRVLSGSEDETLKLWDAARGQLIRTFEGNGGKVYQVAFSPDGERVLSAHRDNTLKLWDAAGGQLIRTFVGHFGPVWSAAFSPDGKRVLSGAGDDLSVKLWNATTGRLIRTLEGHSGAVTSVAFSPDSNRVLSGSYDRTLKLWDAASGQLIRTFNGHPGLVWSVAFSPDGRRVVSGGGDNTLKLWDAASGQLIRTFEGHSGRVLSVVFSHDGTRVFSGSSDGTVRIWDAATGAQLTLLTGGRDGGWLAMTPAGFFASSGSVNELLALVQGFKVTTIGQVHQSLFNPDLVREALAGDLGGEAKEAAKVINLEKVLDSGPAPGVTIISFSEGSQSATDLVTVVVRIDDRGKGVGRVEWRVNGVTAAVAQGPEGDGPVHTMVRELALDPGKNDIEVVAYNGSNLLASLPARITVEFTGSTDQAKPKLHILAIGIDKYIDKGWTPPGASRPIHFKPLDLAAKDAMAFAAALKRAAEALPDRDKYAGVEVVPVLNEAATRDNLERVIDGLKDKIHQRDTFILFAAGHGISEEGRFYLIPQDYQGGPGALKQQAIGQDRLQDWLANRIRARKALILLDTCQSGALIAGHLRSRTDSAASEAGVGRLHEATGRPVLTAAAIGQDAREGYQGHGIFTWALLDALRNGDTSGNGKIELSELVAHVQTHMPKLVAELQKKRGGIEELVASVRAATTQSARFGSRGEDFVLAGRLN
jgi:WD40 repeat protein/uncharacterized caspase-like protein